MIWYRSNRFLRRVKDEVLAVFVVGLVLAPVSWAGAGYKVLHAFGKGNDGGGLFDSVVVDTKGNLYGTAWGGGAYGYGTVFELTPGTGGRWTETILHNFCSQPHCVDGALPFAGLVLDVAGNLYGTAGGGVQNSGVIFELSPDSSSGSGWKFQIIYGSGSGSNLILDKAGNLYGPIGPGKHDAGAVSELVRPSGGESRWKEKVLYSFCSQQPGCRDGEPPEWNVAWDAAGNLYGTTKFGGNGSPACPGSAGCGVVYQLEALGGGKWKHLVLHRFAAFSGDGQLPYAGVVADSKGNIYGTTLQGGKSGTVFKLARQPDGDWKETILYDFPNSGRSGGGPMGGVTFDRSGNLYGTASGGGDPSCQCGVVFKMTPAGKGKWNYTVLHRFRGTDGWSPEASLLVDDKGNLYGTTVAGGAGGAGVVFEITP
jgi:uncharacterized repeat protein (TIGR03803 family)